MNDLYPKAMLRLSSSKGNLFQCCTHWYGVPKSSKLTNRKLNNMARKMLLPISLWFIFQLKLWTLQVDVGLGKWAHYKKASRKQTQSKWEENTPSTPFSSKVLHIRKYKNFYKSRQLLFWSIRVCVTKYLQASTSVFEGWKGHCQTIWHPSLYTKKDCCQPGNKWKSQ